MNKPAKRDVGHNLVDTKQDDINCGYNQAIDGYEKWLKDILSVERIDKIVSKFFNVDNFNKTDISTTDLATELSNQLKEPK